MQQCQGITRSGERCQRAVPDGAIYCSLHVKHIGYSTARILDNNGSVVGSGFLATRNKVLTCSHIMTDSLHLPIGSGMIQLDFPLSGSDPVSASVTAWNAHYDLAAVELEDLPTGVQQVRLILEDRLSGHRFRAFGFPRDDELGVWTAGIIQGQTADSLLQVRGGEVGYKITDGFSGSPVWDEQLEGVVGMINAGLIHTHTRVGSTFALPTERIAEFLPEIAREQAISVKAPRRGKKLKVFLCHASGDKPEVRKLYHKLAKDGFKPWLDEEDLVPGQKWQLEIPKAVHSSDAVVVCLSNNSITKTGYVQKEIRYALDAADERPDDAIFLIPVRLEECNVPTRLSPFHWVNLYEEEGYKRLVTALETIAGTS
jgi:hypothetical protein